MKHILYVASFVVPLVCGANIAMAFIPGVPPTSGPGSVYHGNEEAAPLTLQKSIPSQTPKPSQKSQKPRSNALPK